MLTDTQLRTLKPREKAYKLADALGLYVVVAPTGSKSFRFDCRLDRKRETLTIGRYQEGTPICSQDELQRVLDYLRTRRHYKRNRTIILLTHYAMLRVGEVAALRYCYVLEADGQIKAETTLTAAQTKGKRGRKIWVAEKVRVELAAYVAAHKPKQLTQPLFHTQRSNGFTAHTLTHIVNGVYKGAGDLKPQIST